ncbi:hypothetical protein EC991_011326 [Linnemannia zychae]|nr:hypothetical protein EC991_011326 [Linnemannia zychae]
MAYQNVLHLPEIQQHLAEYLYFSSLKKCAVICKSWHKFFQPLVWRSLTISSYYLPHWDQDRLDSFAKNAQWIKVLHYRSQSNKVDFPKRGEEILIAHCRSLVSLKAWVSSGSTWVLFKRLIYLNQGLRNVELSPDDWGHTYDGHEHFRALEPNLHRALGWQSHLRRLVIGSYTAMPTFMKVISTCPLLEELVFTQSLFPSDSQGRCQTEGYDPQELTYYERDAEYLNLSLEKATYSVDGASTFSLKHIELQRPCSDPQLVNLLVRCPHLTTLCLYHMRRQTCLRIGEKIRQGSFPNFTTYRLSDSWTSDECNEIVHATPSSQLREIKLPKMDPMKVQILIERQLENLEVFEVRMSSDMQHVVHITLLTKCSRLRVLRILGVAADIRCLIESKQPWNCPELEELVMSVRIGRSQSGQQNMELDEIEAIRVETEFLSRVGELTKLRKVHLRDQKGVQWLTWNRATALSLLAGLTQLRELDLGEEASYRFQQGIPELEFMQEHWPHLNSLVRPPMKDSPELVEWLKKNWSELEIRHYIPQGGM